MKILKIEGPRIDIERLTVDDVFDMKRWGTHENPLLEDYNFPLMNDNEIKTWYRLKTQKPSDNYFSIRDKYGELIGYMGIKDIKIFRKSSTLGLVLDPHKTNLGYGTEILETYLKFYFTEMKMRKMILEVSVFNKRAYKLYKKMGFEIVRMYRDEFFNQYLDLKDPYYLKEESSFEIVRGKIYNYIYQMELSKSRFFERIENKELEYRS